MTYRISEIILRRSHRGTVYVGPIPDKPEKIVGVYNSKHQHEYKVAIGGPQLESYGTKYVTLLVHWNKSQRETEKQEKPCLKLSEPPEMQL